MRKTKREREMKLSLSRETLRRLSDPALKEVAAGDLTPLCSYPCVIETNGTECSVSCHTAC